MSRATIEYGGHHLEAYRSLAEQAGVSIRSVIALAAVNRLSLLFDDRGELRRIDRGSALAARAYLRRVRRRWEAREHAAYHP
jgi:hypothetical protein